MPLGGAVETQQLVVVTKQADGSLRTRNVLPVRFVPITGEAQGR
jgi:protein-L-isoaspartate(D-aspartate) O-methyltransferase